MSSYHQRNPLALFTNRFRQRMYPTGGHPMPVFTKNGTRILDAQTAAIRFLTRIPVPGPDHPTWYLKDLSGVSLYEIYKYQPPWAGYTLDNFFRGLIEGQWHDWTTRDFTISRYNQITHKRDESPVYIIDNPNLICVESRFTNRRGAAA